MKQSINWLTKVAENGAEPAGIATRTQTHCTNSVDFFLAFLPGQDLPVSTICHAASLGRVPGGLNLA